VSRDFTVPIIVGRCSSCWNAIACHQSGLATKVEKTNRKNRKERKNRQKKVRCCHAVRFALDIDETCVLVTRFVVPPRGRLVSPPRRSKRPLHLVSLSSSYPWRLEKHLLSFHPSLRQISFSGTNRKNGSSFGREGQTCFYRCTEVVLEIYWFWLRLVWWMGDVGWIMGRLSPVYDLMKYHFDTSWSLGRLSGRRVVLRDVRSSNGFEGWVARMLQDGCHGRRLARRVVMVVYRYGTRVLTRTYDRTVMLLSASLN
jgi:hypothetical protein